MSEESKAAAAADEGSRGIRIDSETHAHLSEAARRLNLAGPGVLLRVLVSVSSPDDAVQQYLEKMKATANADG